MPKETGVFDALSGFVKVFALDLFFFPAALIASLYLTWFAAWARITYDQSNEDFFGIAPPYVEPDI